MKRATVLQKWRIIQYICFSLIVSVDHVTGHVIARTVIRFRDGDTALILIDGLGLIYGVPYEGCRVK